MKRLLTSTLMLVLLPVIALAQAAQPAKRSGYTDLPPSTKAMQDEDSENPAMLWLKDGEAQWNRIDGKAAKSCASCHGAPATMRGAATHYPAFDTVSKAPVNLAQRVNLCRERHQQAAPFAYESPELLGLEILVANQSRGMPLAMSPDPRLQPARARGEQRYFQRSGQLNLSCAQCHDDNAGKRLAGSLIPQGHANGYPIYRLEWQGVGSLQRRLRNCLTGVRAATPALGSAELVELELYLAARAEGLKIETPAVRP